MWSLICVSELGVWYGYHLREKSLKSGAGGVFATAR